MAQCDSTHIDTDEDENRVWSNSTFHLLKGIHTLYFAAYSGQRDNGGDDLVVRSLEHLYGTIHTLVISPNIPMTAESFVHLRGIHTLIIPYKDHINDEACIHLAGIHTLNVSACHQLSDAAFAQRHSHIERGCNINN